MKKFIITAAFILFAGVAFGQTLQKGNLVGLHVMSINLDPDVTMNQYMDFIENKFLPEYEKNFPGLKVYIAKGIRGEHENSFGIVYIFESVETRNKYWPKPDEGTELAKQAFEKLTPIIEERNKLGRSTTTYTDWLIQ